MSAFETLTFPQARAIKSMGEMPMAVLTAGVTAELAPVQVELHQEFAALSTNSWHRIIPGASHARMVTGSKFLLQVAGAIRQVYEEVRNGGSQDQEFNRAEGL